MSQALPPCINRLLCAAKLLIELDVLGAECTSGEDFETHLDKVEAQLTELEMAIEEVEVDLVDQGIELEPFYDAGFIDQEKRLDKLQNGGIIESRTNEGDPDESESDD